MRIIGCGNRDRGDDAAGVLVIERLRALNIEAPGIRTTLCDGDATILMNGWDAGDDVVIVDAVVTGAPSGTIFCWEDGIPPGAMHASASTHGFGVAEAIALARALDRAPKSLRIYGIEGKDFGPGSLVTPDVARAIEDVAQQIKASLGGPLESVR